LRFELGTVLTSFLGHGSFFLGLDLTIRPVPLSGSTSKHEDIGSSLWEGKLIKHGRILLAPSLLARSGVFFVKAK
jgi:hypothetical protein